MITTLLTVKDNVLFLDKQEYGAKEKRLARLNSEKPTARPARKAHGKRIQAGVVVYRIAKKQPPVVRVTSGLINDILSAWKAR